MYWNSGLCTFFSVFAWNHRQLNKPTYQNKWVTTPISRWAVFNRKQLLIQIDETTIVTCTKKMTSAIQVLFIHKKNRGKHVSSRSVSIIGILKITTTYKWIYMHYIWTSINWLAPHSLRNKRFTSHHGKYTTNSFLFVKY